MLFTSKLDADICKATLIMLLCIPNSLLHFPLGCFCQLIALCALSNFLFPSSSLLLAAIEKWMGPPLFSLAFTLFLLPPPLLLAILALTPCHLQTLFAFNCETIRMCVFTGTKDMDYSLPRALLFNLHTLKSPI